uniref:C-type lectin domain-containing protein n=1 Tax=Periophthalmus magnuspinnatus TaxID=409849 RepID=A0A3B4ADB8_9GOBI
TGAFFIRSMGLSVLPKDTMTAFICGTWNHTANLFAHYSAMATWRTAQDTCRNNHMDLVTVTSTEINSAVQGLVTAGHEAWIGLFRDAWEWSDGSDTSYRSWVDGGDGDGDCAAASVEHEGFWSVTQCTEKLPFVCEGGEALELWPQSRSFPSLSYWP